GSCGGTELFPAVARGTQFCESLLKSCDIVDLAMISANKTAELVIPIHLDKADISASVYLRAIRTPFFWLFPLWVIVMVVFFLSSYFHTSRLYAWVWGLIAGPISLFFLLQRSSASIAKQASTLAPMTLTF